MSNYFSPLHRPRRWWLWYWLTATLIIALAHFVDHAAWQALRLPTEEFRRAEGKDWYRFLRILGFWPTWLAAGGCLIIGALTQLRRSRPIGTIGPLGPWGVGLILSSGFAGGIAELAKLIIRRGRPGGTGQYTFDWPITWSDPPGMGTISSHAAVAFGAAFFVARIFPGAGWIAIPLAIGCGVTRLIAGAHFLTDVLAAGVIGYAVACHFSRVLVGAVRVR
jgi:membrane-associated phospholipid phosphatase